METRELKSRLELPWVRCCFENLGFSYLLLAFAFERQLKENGNDFEHSQQIIETLWYFHEEMQEREIASFEDYVNLCVATRQSRFLQREYEGEGTSAEPAERAVESNTRLIVSPISASSAPSIQ